MSTEFSEHSGRASLALSTWTSRLSSSSTFSVERIKKAVQAFWTPQLCESCANLDLGSTTDSLYSKESSMMFDFQRYQSHVPRCPLCTLILHRIPSFRMLGSASNDPTAIQLKVKGQVANVWADGRNVGRIRPVRFSSSSCH